MRPWLAVAAVNGLIAVAAGALGAHGLQSLVDVHAQQAFETAVRYQMYHALVIGLVTVALRGKFATLACVLFLAGIVLFTGSLYLLAQTGAPIFGLITPVGGANLLAGWITFAYAAWRTGSAQ